MAWGYQGILASVRNFLGVPLGAVYKSHKGDVKSTGGEINDFDPTSLDLVQSIVSTTVDDICIGAAPFYYKVETSPRPKEKAKYDKILNELNSIADWVAYDLLTAGVSVYKVHLVKRGIRLYPYLDPVKVVLNRDKEVVCYTDAQEKINDCLVFVNYDKTSLSAVKDKEYNFEITPKPMQLANAAAPASELAALEKALSLYRQQISKVVRFATVEVGVSKGDDIDELIDSISSGLNANSSSFNVVGDNTQEFDDEIPIFPTRKGLGKPEISEHVSSANIKDLADLDYSLGKLLTSCRFPKTYIDFSTNLTPTAASMIRGDIRYSRLLKKVRTKMEITVNEYFSTLAFAERCGLEFKMQEVPNPEDSEVVESLQGYTDFLKDATDYIFEAETSEDAEYRLQSYVDLLGDSSNLKSIEKWIQNTRDFIKKKYSSEEEETNDEDSDYEESDEGSEDEDFRDLGNPSSEAGDLEVGDLEGPEESEAEESSEESSEESTSGEIAPNVRPPVFP